MPSKKVKNVKRPAPWLKRLYLSSGNPVKVLPVWFRGSKILKSSYRSIVKGWHKRKFQFIDGVSQTLQLHLACCLQSVKLSCYTTLLRAYERKWDRLSLSPLHWIPLCPPIGVWENVNRNYKFCRNLFCPWCWMRRHDLIYRSVLGERGRQLSTCGRSIRGTGLGTKLHCLSFRARGTGFFNSPAHYNEMTRCVNLETAEIRKSHVLIRLAYPLIDLSGATIAFLSDQPFDLTNGTVPFPSLPGGEMGIHTTAKPLHVSRLIASRMQWAPEMLSNPDAALKACEVFRGKNLFNVIGGNDGPLQRV